MASLGPSGAAEFRMLSAYEQDLTLAQFVAEWDDISNPNGPLVCTRSQTLVNLKDDLEQLCSWNPGECDVNVQGGLQRVSAAVDRMLIMGHR